MNKPLTVDPVQLEDAKSVLDFNMRAISAMADAVEVLTALVTLPDAAVSTADGYALGRRLNCDTLPVLAEHIKYLADKVDNEIGFFFYQLGADHE